ncbi:GntR family transcriptional regulator [Actinoallomurus rhizosphaericola]|uniref:GntR family transcriptional regulator n=1 Tax=Actinoallomurus rhizosphaericola TaxID=2952536 RepID=UPI00209316B9|nr:GntR family transcriptional regulator [Actinoallomurus rhizosphaericola]MCO5997904.1 GntR family transcriptional regulator [Actinoallomurus rhizosphaericola]
MAGERPRFLEVRRLLRRRIETGEYQPGAPIPSINDLAAEQRINRLTVMKAIDPLIEEGLLRSVAGRGIFVVGEKVARELETLDGFTRTMTERNAEPSLKVLAKAVRAAGPKYSAIFDIGEDEDLCFIRRLCLSGGTPFSLEEILFPADLLPGLDRVDLSVFSLYELYSFYGVKLARAWQTLGLARSNAKDARALDVPEGTALLLFECSSYDEENRLVEFTRTLTRGDRASFVAHFQR